MIEYSSTSVDKRWYFVLHVARCVIISPSFLFSLSQPVWHFFPHIFFSIVALICCFTQRPHGGASHLFFFFCFISLIFHHRSSVLSPFLPLLSVSLSVMAYQDGFYGAADLYVSIYISTLLPHSCFPPVACGFSSVKWQRTNPQRCLLFKCLHFPHSCICSLPLRGLLFLLRVPNCSARGVQTGPPAIPSD